MRSVKQSYVVLRTTLSVFLLLTLSTGPVMAAQDAVVKESAIDDAARTAILAGRGLSRIIDSSEKGLPVLMSKMSVYVPTPAEMKQFRDLSIPAATAFLEKEYGREGKVWIDKFLSAIAAAERELGY